jgi:hypothetical protein
MRSTAVPLAALFLLTTVAPLAGAPGTAPEAAAPAAAVGMYRAVRFEQRPLPASERIPATKGYFHYVKLDQAAVTLRADGKFIASFRYWHHHLKDGAPVPRSPMLSETHRGTYTVRGGRVTFTPDAKKQRTAPIAGTLTGGMLRVNYTVQGATGPRALRLDLERDGNW